MTMFHDISEKGLTTHTGMFLGETYLFEIII